MFLQHLTVTEAQDYFTEVDLPSLFIRSVVDENGNPMFTEDDREALTNMHPGFAFKLRLAIDKFNGFSKEADAETELKNS